MTADLIYHQNVSVIFTWSIFDCEAIIRSRLYNKSAALLLCHCEEEISSRFYRSCSDSKYDLYYLLILATFSWLRKVFQRFRLIFSCGRQSLKFYKLRPFCFLVTQRSSRHDVMWRHKCCIQRSDLSHGGIPGLWRYLSVSTHAVIG